jgi:hypothetical protein
LATRAPQLQQNTSQWRAKIPANGAGTFGASIEPPDVAGTLGKKRPRLHNTRKMYHRRRPKGAYPGQGRELGGHVRDPSGGCAFDPDVTDAMSVAFAAVCRALDVPETDKAQREKIAVMIIDFARHGEHDANKLRERVLQAAGSPPERRGG